MKTEMREMLVARDEILDFVTYGEQRDAIRGSALAAKRDRRVLVGDHLTLLFENHETIRYQILEMIRTEQIVRERDILHELETYNELLGGPGELGCTLLVGVEDPNERDVLLRRWLTLPEHLYVRLPGDAIVRATWDPRQVGEDRLSSVQYLKFAVGDAAPIACGSDHPELTLEVSLTAAQRDALAADLARAAAG